MILAAGRGERMGPLTDALPKPLLSLGDETLIERQLRRLAAAGFDEIVINLSYRGEQILAALGDGARYGVRIEYSREPEPPLETAGGIVEALPLLGEGPFLLVNADVVTDFDPGDIGPPRGEGLLVLVPNPEHHPDGDFGLADDGRLTATAPRLTFAGISLLDTALFAGLARGRRSLKSVLDAAIERGVVYGRVHRGCWLDVGTPARLEKARALLTGAA